jgi:hypothetical protein
MLLQRWNIHIHNRLKTLYTRCIKRDLTHENHIKKPWRRSYQTHVSFNRRCIVVLERVQNSRNDMERGGVSGTAKWLTGRDCTCIEEGSMRCLVITKIFVGSVWRSYRNEWVKTLTLPADFLSLIASSRYVAQQSSNLRLKVRPSPISCWLGYLWHPVERCSGNLP